MSRTTSHGTPRRARAGTVAFATIAAGAMVSVVAPGASSITGAADPTVTPILLDGTVETSPLGTDDGSIVLLTSVVPPDPDPDPDPDPTAIAAEPDPVTTLRLHDRTSATTIDLPDLTGEFAAISGDGCTIAGVVSPAAPVDPAEIELRIIDRCVEDPTLPLASVVVASTRVAGSLALDADGDTLVVNTGDEIVRYTRGLATETGPATPFAITNSFDVDPLASDVWDTIGRVDVSDDGAVVVFEAIEVVDPAPPEPPVSSVYAWEADTIALVAADAGHPSVSGDGRLVAVDVRSAAGPGVAVVDRAAVDAAVATVSIDPAGDLPTISADGAHLLYVVPTGDSPGLRRTTWTGDGTVPFAEVVTTDLSAPPEGEVRAGVPTTAPSASRFGDVVAFDEPTSADVLVWATPITASFGAAEYDLGSGEVGVTLSGVATLINDGDATLDLTAADVAVGSPFSIVDPGPPGSCAGALRPGASCTIAVEYVVPAAIDAVADLTVTPTGADAPLATTRLIAVGTTTTTTSTSTTTSSTTSPPVVTTPNTTPRNTPPRNTTPRNTTPRNTTRNTTPVTTPTTTVPPAQPGFSPSAFDFAPTIVDAGRRVASISLVNPSPTAAQVTAIGLDPEDAGFVIEAGTDCVGASLVSGSTCRVDIAFAPQVDGPTAASLVATFADGGQVVASITGLGAPPPVVDVVPGVASTGQVVTVRGAGFPAGALVELSVGTELRPHSITINDVGGFDLPIVVLPNTKPGPLVVSVAGQVDLFPTVDTSFLITVTSDRTSPAVLRGVGPSIGR